MRIWNFGIIGAGAVAEFHAKSIQHLENARLIGVCGSGSGRAEALAKKYGCRVFPDYHAMLRSGEIDIVTIATPSGLHMEPAVEAARCGKHVLCEKPLDISLERIDAMIEAHDKAGTQLGGDALITALPKQRISETGGGKRTFGVISFASIHVPSWRSDEYY